MAQDHSVLGLQLLVSCLSSSSSSAKWCVHECVLDLLGRAGPMELYFFLFLFLRGIVCGFGYVFSKYSPNWDFVVMAEKFKTRMFFIC